MSLALVQQSTAAVAPESGSQEVALVPPHDLDAEAAVVSAVLLDPSALARLEDFLLPEHFYSEAHRRIFDAAREVAGDGDPVDVTTVGAKLKARGRLVQVGGLAYITSILDSTPAPANVRAHATVVFERWRVRQAMLTCERAAAFGHGVVDAQAYLESVTRSLSELARQRPGAKVEGNFEMLRRLVRQLHEGARAGSAGGKGRGIPTGIRGYDDQTLGLFAGHKTTVVAPPRVGKTAFALQIAINVAQLGVGVAFFSTEMTRDEIGVRELAYLARVDSRRIQQAFQKPTLEPAEWKRITESIAEQEQINASLHVFDETGPTVDDICAKAKMLAELSTVADGKPLGLIVVDYVQNLRPAPLVERKPKHEQIGYATKRLKDLAQELKLPVLELAQEKNREVDKAKGCRPRPSLGDAADCFQIERSANNVVYLWRPRERDGAHVKAILVKQRNGEEGEIDLKFDRAHSRFEDLPHGPMTSPARQYVAGFSGPPPGRFDDDDDDDDTGSSTLTGGL